MGATILAGQQILLRNGLPVQQAPGTCWANIPARILLIITQVPGFKVTNYQFPLAASGLSKLYIRLRVKNKITGSMTAPTGGTLTAAGISRLGHLSIKYNK
jgi:hypothetical protein